MMVARRKKTVGPAATAATAKKPPNTPSTSPPLSRVGIKKK
jgi:hypothetical protein